jgi:hypothetical protein
MGLFKRTRGDKTGGPEVTGTLGYFGLGEWWLTTFTEEERAYIEEKHKPMGGLPGVTLTKGHIGQTTQTAAGLLVSLSTWFTGPGDRHLAIRMLEKADSLAGSNIIDRHMVYGQMVKDYYAERETQPGALDAAIVACERQIAIAPQVLPAWVAAYPSDPPITPKHSGYVQLAIIREKQGDYAEALRLCQEAKSQGWRSDRSDRDWSKRIARLEGRLSKTE